MRIAVCDRFCWRAAVLGASAAASWKEVDRLPGDIAVELDETSMSEAMDGARSWCCWRPSAARCRPGSMESDIAVNCTEERRAAAGAAPGARRRRAPTTSRFR